MKFWPSLNLNTADTTARPSLRFRGALTFRRKAFALSSCPSKSRRGSHHVSIPFRTTHSPTPPCFAQLGIKLPKMLSRRAVPAVAYLLGILCTHVEHLARFKRLSLTSLYHHSHSDTLRPDDLKTPTPPQPAIASLRQLARLVKKKTAPYLYLLLNDLVEVTGTPTLP